MKKGFKPASIVFYLLMFVVFFFIGIYVAGFVGAGKNQMLAGGAIVVGWGVLFAGLAFVSSFFIVYFVQHKYVVRLNWILLIMLLLLYGITHYRYIERQKEKENSEIDQSQKKTTQPIGFEQSSMRHDIMAADVEPIKMNTETIQTSDSKMGMAFFSPLPYEHPILYFYGGVNFQKGPADHSPQDSVVFTLDQYQHLTTSYAPPWLFPENLKLDYGIIIFKVLGVGHDFVKVEANRQNGQTTYLDINKGKFLSWPQFLLTVNSVEFNATSMKKVFVKPLDYAGELSLNFEFMQPLFVQEDWMYVRLVNGNLEEQGMGWIRWKKDNLLHISYSLLS